MSDLTVKFNNNQVPNLYFKKPNNKLEISVVINHPDEELEKLKALAALRDKAGLIELSDIDADQSKEEKDQIFNSLEGRYLYKNDGCPMMGKLNLRYDLNQALQMLTELKNKMGQKKFSESKVIFTESFIGEKTMGNHPPHHVIRRVEAFTNVNGNLHYDDKNRPQPLPLKNEQGVQTTNLNLYKDSGVMLTQTINSPSQELKTLTEIAALDGNVDSISETDLKKAKQNGQLNHLEGLDLYTDDVSDDATLYDLNAAYDFLSGAKDKLTNAKVMFKEKLYSNCNRFYIEEGQLILNENSGKYFKIYNKEFVTKE